MSWTLTMHQVHSRICWLAALFCIGVLACALNGSTASALPASTGLQNEAVSAFRSLYPDVEDNLTGPGSTPQRCRSCHRLNTTDPRNSFGESLEGSVPTSAIDLPKWIQDVAERATDPFVPKLKSPSSARVKAKNPTDIMLDYDNGNTVNGGVASLNSVTLLSARSEVSLSSFNKLTVTPDTTVGLKQGEILKVQPLPKNNQGFELFTIPASSNSNVKTIDLVVNTLPTQLSTDGGSVDDGSGIYISPVINTLFSDANDDNVTGFASGGMRPTAVVSGGSALNITPTFGSGGNTIQFDTNAFSDLVPGESRTVTISFEAWDKFDVVSGQLVVTVNGVDNASNSSPKFDIRQVTVDEDETGLPIPINLLEDNNGTPYTDPDPNDSLSVTGTVPNISSFRGISRSNSIVTLSDLSSFNSLGAGETGTIEFDYSVTETRTFRTGLTAVVATTPVQFKLTVNGINDPPTVDNSSISTSLDESVIRANIDVLDLAGASDVDANDTLRLENLRNLVLPPQVTSLASPGQFRISSSGTLVELQPSFDTALATGQSVAMTFEVDVVDGSGASVPIRVAVNISAVMAGHGALAGRYANNLKDRYPLSNFQQASTPGSAACFTCHIPDPPNNDALFSAKPNCADPNAFTWYGQRLCETNRGGEFFARLTAVEDEFAPTITETDLIRDFLETDVGVQNPDPIETDPGFRVDRRGSGSGAVPSTIHSYFIEDNIGGAFTISAAGRVTLAKRVAPGTYPLRVLPRNIAGSKTAGGSIRNVPGFYPLNKGFTVLTVVVAEAAPVTVADDANTFEDQPVSIAVVANDVGGSPSRISLDSSPANGSAAINGLSVSYTPAPGFTGQDSFTYSSENGAGVSAPATVTITVVAQGGVLAKDDKAVTVTSGSARIDVLANDVGVIRQGANATVVTISVPPDPSTGSVSVDGQSVTFNAASGFTGRARFRYNGANPGLSGLGGSSAEVVVEVLPTGSGVIANAVRDPELRRVAQSFEQSCVGATNQEFLNACVNLTAAALNGEDIENAMRALRNEEHFATVDVAQTMARDLGRGISNRIRNLRNGGVRGFDISGVNVTMSGESIPTQLFSNLVRGTLGLSPEDQLAGSPWGFFVAGDFSFSERDSTTNSEGFESRAANILVGLDYRPSESRAIGAAIGYTDADTDFSDGGGLDSKAYQASVYGYADDWIAPGIDFDGYVTLGTVSYDSDRGIQFQANGLSVDESAQADFDGTYINIVPTISYVQGLGKYGDSLEEVTSGTELRWIVGLDYLRLKTDAYTETGGGGLALNIESETYDSLQLVFGVNASRPIYLARQVKAELRGGLTARGELLDGTRYVTSSFINAGIGAPSFTISEDGSNGIGGTIDLGLSVDLYLGQLDLDYAYDFSNDGFSSHALSIGYQKSFSDRSDLSLGFQQDFTDSFDLQGQYELRF